MKTSEFDEKYGRQFLIGAVLLIWGMVLIHMHERGYLETWRLWKVPTESPPFVDFRIIPGSAESFRAGFDPAVENPYDPKSRLFNYPKLWYLVFYTGISQDDTIWLSITLLVMFFLIVFAFPKKLWVRDAVILLAVIFSYASMLLYERGNVDIVFFILCGLVILYYERFPKLAMGILSIAAIFKYFPFFGILIFLREEKRRFFKVLLICLSIFLTYVVFSFDSVMASWELTNRGTVVSYGIYVVFGVLYAYLRYYLLKVIMEHQISLAVTILPFMFAMATLAISVFLGQKKKDALPMLLERNLGAFRMGASIYVGTFLLGNNWDYRLAFLIFTVPQITQWLFNAPTKYRWVLLGILAVLLISCWGNEIIFYAKQLFGKKYFLQIQVFDEIANWLLFAGLVYLLTASAPQWVKEYLSKISKRSNPQTPRSKDKQIRVVVTK